MTVSKATHRRVGSTLLSRRHVLALAAASTGFCLGCKITTDKQSKITEGAIMPEPQNPIVRMPSLFIGHGSPMNAIEDNRYSRGFRELGAALPRPKAVLSISAHWYVRGTHVTSNAAPKTIHDFGGFPEELYRVEYPAPGDPKLAAHIVEHLGAARATLRDDWGLDHGTWSVLCHVLPKADCPVLQLSIDESLAPSEHLAIGRALAPLRDEGILVMGSGNITHNLRHAFSMMRAGGAAATPDWASRFDTDVAAAVENHDGDALVRMIDTDAGRMSHPTLDHYLPLLYAVGASAASDRVAFPVSGFDLGSLSMRSVRFG